MFIAIRDLRFAKGRFFLMGFVVTLVAFLVITLSGLSAGLVKANISGLMALPVTHVAFEDSDHPGYRNTMIERYMWEGWAGKAGVEAMEPLGHTVFNARTDDGRPLEIALWGLVDDSFIAPVVDRGITYGGDVGNGVVISRGLQDEGVDVGDLIILDRVLTELRVVGVTTTTATSATCRSSTRRWRNGRKRPTVRRVVRRRVRNCRISFSISSASSRCASPRARISRRWMKNWRPRRWTAGGSMRPRPDMSRRCSRCR